MVNFKYIGNFLVIFGLITMILGLVLSMNIKLPPWIGRLPGDIFIQKKNFSFYFPFTTCLLVSLLLTMLFWFFGKK